MKKILKLVLGLLLVGSMELGVDSAKVIISTEVGETTANSGIRVVQSYVGGTDATAFDTAFFSAGSVITLASGKDTSVEVATGGFVVMVRRPTSAAVNIAVSGTPMASGTSTIPYKILGTELPDAVVYVDYISGSSSTVPTIYEANTVVGSILRDAKTFTYSIPVSALAPLGTYSATVTFTITTT